jgi:hypothetical protein
MMRNRGRGWLVAAAVAAVVLAGCDGGPNGSAATSEPNSTTASTTTASASPTTTTRPRASRSTPLAERVFRVDPKPTTATQQAIVGALEGYLDGLITAFATNNVARSGVRRFTTPAMYADAQRMVAEQVKAGYVLYGAYVVTIQVRGARSRAAVVGACIDQSRTRRHNPTTDAAGRRNNTPYVRLNYTLNRLDHGWVVVDYSGRLVASCPG